MCSTSLAVICNGTLIGFNNEGNVTKIEIDFNDGEIESFTPSMIATKVYAAYNEAKAKEIKAGDWLFYIPSKTIGQIIQLDESDYKNAIKLPQEIQDGLNEFVADRMKF